MNQEALEKVNFLVNCQLFMDGGLALKIAIKMENTPLIVMDPLFHLLQFGYMKISINIVFLYTHIETGIRIVAIILINLGHFVNMEDKYHE